MTVSAIFGSILVTITENSTNKVKFRCISLNNPHHLAISVVFSRNSSNKMTVKGVPGKVFFKTVMIGLASMVIGSSVVHHIYKPLGDLEELVQQEMERRK